MDKRMKDEILQNIENPRGLEKLYRENKAGFRRAFNHLYPKPEESTIVRFWYERLNFEDDEASLGAGTDLLFVIIAALLAGLIAKLPEILSIDGDFFYPRNTGFIVFPILTAYFAWKNNVQAKEMIFICGATLAGLLFINLLPNNPGSDTLLLSCIHLPLFLWCVLGYAYTGNKLQDHEKWLSFLRYNGDLIVVTTLILIAGMILTGVTIGLFALIHVGIEKFYFQYVVIAGIAAAPIVGTYLTQVNPGLINKVSPVIARIFSPLVLLTLVAYLIAIALSGKNPYTDREFLLLFNLLLIGVMAIIFFSVAGSSKANRRQAEVLVLFLLAAVTVIVNGIALSAILFRISEWGITPNRLAVLGGNVLMLANLLFITFRLYKALRKKADIADAGKAIAIFLPIYFTWTVMVTFLFPLIFGFK